MDILYPDWQIKAVRTNRFYVRRKGKVVIIRRNELTWNESKALELAAMVTYNGVIAPDVAPEYTAYRVVDSVPVAIVDQ